MLAKTAYLSSGTFTATYWWPDKISMYQVSFWSATTTVFPSADPFSSMTFASSSIASRADFARGKITSNIAASGRPSALRGSFASTFLFGIAVTVDVIETPASLKPCSPKAPLLPSPRAES